MTFDVDPGEVRRIVATALAEDLGVPPRDVTSEATIPADRVDAAELVARAPSATRWSNVAVPPDVAAKTCAATGSPATTPGARATISAVSN